MTSLISPPVCKVTALLFLFVPIAAKNSCGRIAYDVWPITLPLVDLDNVSLAQAVSAIKREVSHLQGGKGVLNVVVHSERLSSGEPERRFSFRAANVTIKEAVYAICKATGAGYRIEPFAIVISARSHVGLPRAPSERVAKIPDGAPPRRFLFFTLRPR